MSNARIFVVMICIVYGMQTEGSVVEASKSGCHIRRGKAYDFLPPFRLSANLLVSMPHWFILKAMKANTTITF